MIVRSLPLTAHAAAAVIAHRPEGAVSVAQFIADARRLAALMPAGGQLLNICQDRYHFMVGFAAGMLAGKISLQPPSRSAAMLAQLKAGNPDLFCLSDAAEEEVDLPLLRYPPPLVVEADAAAPPMPQIEAERVVAHVFTSGSTGAPLPHAKTWGSLVDCARAESRCLGLGGLDGLDDEASGATGHAIVGTVPPQHMFGFESTVLLTLHGGCTMGCGHPFYPADIAAQLAQVPPPRLLVTTPFHLRALLDAEVAVPPLGLVLCATAPLSGNLAQRAEQGLAAPLHEIYGSTETGQIASRRTTAAATWQLFPGVRLEQQGQQWLASGGHLAQATPLADVLELVDARHFLLHGRSADLVNIAGKRSSLAHLNHQLNAIAGVEDGSFFMPDESDADGITRLCAFVVAPSLSAAQLLDALRQRIDPIFLPRPLLLLESLPRNSVGKLPRGELQALLDRRGRRPA